MQAWPKHERPTRWVIDFVDNLANLRFQEAVKDVRVVRDPFGNPIAEARVQAERSATSTMGFRRPFASARDQVPSACQRSAGHHSTSSTNTRRS